MYTRTVRTLLALPLLFCLSGCGFIDYFFLPPPEDTAQELFETAGDAMREKDYVTAAEYFGKLRDQYPFSPYAVEAELALGDALFLDEEYLQAADVYKEFEALHPRHESIPYVLMQVGLSNLKSFVSIDRPQTNIAEAYEYFSRVQESFPNTDFAVKAIEHAKECRILMAKHELFVADYYWRSERYRSAAARYKYVLQNFPDIPQEFLQYAQEKGQIAYLRATENDSEKSKNEQYGSWKNWLEWL